jgi:RimJ/RimL family protein N-acetyltransferase
MNQTKENFFYDLTDSDPKLIMRLIDSNDLENLRSWKNSQKMFFFHTALISEQQQIEWYKSYEKRNNDFMFLILNIEKKPIGCMGIRLINEEWDIYNVILGSINYGKLGLMSKSFMKMLDFAYTKKNCPIGLKVLKHNPAVDWYKKNGMSIIEEHLNYYYMLLKN